MEDREPNLVKGIKEGISGEYRTNQTPDEEKVLTPSRKNAGAFRYTPKESWTLGKEDPMAGASGMQSEML